MMRAALLFALATGALLFVGPLSEIVEVAAADVAVTIREFKFNPDPLTVPVGTRVTWTNEDSAGHTATSDASVFRSPLLSRGGSFSFTFTQPGEYTYHCEPHPWITGKVIVQASTAAPGLTAPAEGARLESFGPALTWTNGPGTTQVHLQVVPFNNDGPGVNVLLGSAATSFAIPPPPQWYGLLPDITYMWRVRTSDSGTAVGPEDSSWGPWAERGFRTPAVASSTLTPVAPANGGTVSGRTPTLQWANSRSDVFYYEVQVSKDPGFGPSAFLYFELRHGGVTSPPNSYAVPSGFPLEVNTTYHWRVRPRVQGDGAPVAWLPAWSFRTTDATAGPTPTATPTATPTQTATVTPTATATTITFPPGNGGY